jgi:tetratricopeptide (TPR) repeat protein/predicted secreted protein
MYAFPLRPPTIAWLGGMAVASVVVAFLASLSPVLGLALSAAWWVMAFKLATEALTTAAEGGDATPGREDFASDSVAFRQLMLGLGLVAVGALCWIFGGTGARIAFGTAVVLLVPAMIVVLVMDDSMVSALDPRNWARLLGVVGMEYLVVAGQIALLAVVVGLALAAIPAIMPNAIGTAVAHFLVLYLMLAAYHGLGALLDRHREAMDRPDEPRAPAPPPGASPEEVEALREARRLLAAARHLEAVGVLDRLIRGRGATAAVHAQYRELLAGLGDDAALQAHARAHVATLLQLGQGREALALYLDARRRDPSFELADPQPVSELIAYAARQHQSQLAVSLAEEFARRFPRDRDLVLNQLTAARLMDRLGRDDEARSLLQDLLRRFPEHALAPELELALQAIVPGPARH